MTVTQAAQHLGVNAARVRALVSSGALAGRRIGSQWVVDRGAIERRGQIVGAGGRSRSMSARVAWAAADLLDGGNAAWLATSERARLRSRLAAHGAAGWQTYSRWLASRQTSADRYRVGDGDIAAVLAADGVVATGASAASAYGLGLSAAGQAEAYADSATAAGLVDEFFLIRSTSGNLLLRTVDGDWHRRTAAAEQGRATAARLMVAVDLLDADDTRSRSAGRGLLAGLLAGGARAV
ncbi:MAG: helix-turn-helix domain-containing protein [Actinobacteria bacterium]|nr:helix-turn-helix domain-containing protein [Actinomycetota bacterium]MCA1721326.1 helix-turn-helix domain-containing protein [Actinomycetota bacterium]